MQVEIIADGVRLNGQDVAKGAIVMIPDDLAFIWLGKFAAKVSKKKKDAGDQIADGTIDSADDGTANAQ